MNIFRYTGDEPGQGVSRYQPPKRGLARFFYVFFRDFFGFVKLSLLFTVFCVPVITVPAACTAMSKIAFLMARDEQYSVWPDFWEAFRKEFLRSTLLGWLLFGGIGLTAASAYSAFLQIQNSDFFYAPLVVSSACALLLMITGFYLFPMLAIIDLPPKQILKNALFLAILYQPYNLFALAAIGALWYPIIQFLPISILLLPLLFFALMSYIATFCANGGINKYVLQKEG